MHPLYRQLAPAPPGETPGPSGNVPQEKKKKKARMACNYCRQKRVRCDQGRPICNRCVHLGLPCAYMSDDAGATPTMALKNENEILQRRLRGHIEYLEAIRNASEDEAFDIIRRLRSTDIATALALHSQSQVSAISQPSEVPSTRMVTSSADSEFDLDLDSTWYSDLMSPNLSLKAPTSLDRKPSSPTKIPISSPEHIALCDTRLQGLAVKYWTQIPIDDRLAAQAISHLLISEHPVVGFLDVNLFLNDVVNQALYYCSSFLFHVVMALACQSYSVVVFSIASFTTAFVDEALKMWPNERSTDSRSTLAALNCLSVATGWDGRDKLQNDRLLEDARAMAIRLQMLDVASTTASMDQFQSISEDDMGSHAWGDFGWHS